jgi:hypothetical protein
MQCHLKSQEGRSPIEEDKIQVFARKKWTQGYF